MTEYETSPEAVAEYMASRQRTMNWVETHDPNQTQFYSPSVPPTVVGPEGTATSGIASPAESSASLPPRMVLKYNDGRADIPISHWHYNDPQRGSKGRHKHSDARAHGESRNAHHRRSKSLSSRPDSQTSRELISEPSKHHRRRTSTPSSPEEIRVLPSPPDGVPSSLKSQSRSNSYSQRSPSRQQRSPPISHFVQTPQSIYYDPNPFSLAPGPPPQNVIPVAHSQSQPISSRSGSRGFSGKSRSPPAIVYAPSRHSKTNYAPPTIVQSRPSPPGVTYSQSAPVPLPSQMRYPHAGNTPYPSAHGSQLSSVREEKPGSRKSSRRFMDSAVFVSDVGETESYDSGSTYYVLPTAGQKVHVIPPETSPTSTNKSPTSPRSNFRKPFFSRLFSKFSSDNSSKISGRLQRRHSTDSSGRRDKGFLRAY